MTNPRGWTGTLPLCPLIFSWEYSTWVESVTFEKLIETAVYFNYAIFLRD